MLKNTLTRYLPNKQQESAYGDGRPKCNRVHCTSGSVGMGIPMGILMGIPVGMGWVWGLKCHPHGSTDNITASPHYRLTVQCLYST